MGSFRSLSARRAWIEIPRARIQYCPQSVALRKESVDRNLLLAVGVILGALVALRKESVDRNLQKLAEAINPS